MEPPGSINHFSGLPPSDTSSTVSDHLVTRMHKPVTTVRECAEHPSGRTSQSSRPTPDTPQEKSNSEILCIRLTLRFVLQSGRVVGPPQSDLCYCQLQHILMQIRMGLYDIETGNLGSRNTTTGLFSEQTTVRNPTTNYLVTPTHLVFNTAASSGLRELTPSSSLPTLTSRCMYCCWRQTMPAPIPPLCADPSPAHVSPRKS